MKDFFRENLILFCLVWNEQIEYRTVADWFEGRASFQELLEDIDFYEDHEPEMSKILDVTELEYFCRKHSLVNFHGN